MGAIMFDSTEELFKDNADELFKKEELHLIVKTKNDSLLDVDRAINERKANLYKTEMCRSVTTSQRCIYGDKCQFAHHKKELRVIKRHPRYKTELCKTYDDTGKCPYENRCCFVHPDEINIIYEQNEVKIEIEIKIRNERIFNKELSETLKKSLKMLDINSKIATFIISNNPNHHLLYKQVKEEVEIKRIQRMDDRSDFIVGKVPESKYLTMEREEIENMKFGEISNVFLNIVEKYKCLDKMGPMLDDGKNIWNSRLFRGVDRSRF